MLVFQWRKRSRTSGCLPQRAREAPGEAGHLISKAGVAVEVEVPPIARKAPVTNVGDPPVGRRFDFNDEIHAATIGAIDLAAAENHLAALRISTQLSGREPERYQDRIKGLRDHVRTTRA